MTPFLLLYTLLYMAMRTQIYLTQAQRVGLDEVRRTEGKTLASVVREAVDQFLSRRRPDLEKALAETFGAAANLSVPSRDEWQKRG